MEPDHGQITAGGKNLVSRMRVVPDIGLGDRRDISWLIDRTGHDHDLLQQSRQPGFEFERQREIAHGANADQLNLAGELASHLDDEFGSTFRFDLSADFATAMQIAEAVVTMNKLGMLAWCL